MKDMYPSGGSSVSGMAITDEAAGVRKRWLYSFLAYYGYAVTLFLVALYFESVSLYALLYAFSRLLIPCLHYYFYRRAGIYWFMLFTSIAVSLVPTYGLLEEVLTILQSKSLIGFILVLIQACLFVYFVYYCFQLTKINIQKNPVVYPSVVRNLWIVSLIICRGLSFLRHVYSLDYGFKVSIAKALGILSVEALVVYICYVFAVQRKGVVALLVILLFFPWPRFDVTDSFFNKVAWLGFFIYFCVSTYRLYKINRSEREEMAKAGNDSVEQISI